MDPHLVETILMYLIWRRRKRNQKKRVWVQPINSERQKHGAYYVLYPELRKNPRQFFNYFKMSIGTFDELLNLLKNKIRKADTHMRLCISATERLVITLRYLSSGCSLTNIHTEYRVGVTTTSVVIENVCNAIWETLYEQCIPKPTRKDWLEIANGFSRNTAFPHCIGAIDGKLVQVLKAKNIHMLVMADTKFRFTFVSVTHDNRDSNLQVYNKTALYACDIGIPDPDFLPGECSKAIPYVILGGDSFGLSKNLLRPYPSRDLLPKKKLFNARVFHARRCVENALCILTTKWAVFDKPFTISLRFTESVVKACLILHNFTIARDGYAFEDTLSYQGLMENEVASRGSYGKGQNIVRDYLASYFMEQEEQVKQQEQIQQQAQAMQSAIEGTDLETG